MPRIGFISAVSLLTVAPISPITAQDLLWTRQAGTSQPDNGLGVAVDGAGNAYITGYTWGDLGGPNAGVPPLFDNILAKYDALGTLLWIRQTGTSGWDHGEGVAVDGAGNVYVTGPTLGSLGGPNAGRFDYFLARYNALGSELWTRQAGSAAIDFPSGVAVDNAGNVYIAGYTEGNLGGPNAGLTDYFLAKYDASGALIWTRQSGTATEDESYGVSVDGAGNAFITGRTQSSLGGPFFGGYGDCFLAKYDTSGVLVWTRQLGTALTDVSRGVAVDEAGNAYITGSTLGSLGAPNAGNSDVFLAKYDASGVLLWTHQIGTSADDQGKGVAVDRSGGVFVTGSTQGSLGGPIAGNTDVFLAKYDPAGTLLWLLQEGTSQPESAYNVAADGAGNAYITGYTRGSLGGPNAGSEDYFLAKYGDACYADCDQSTGYSVLDVFDFLCFQNSFISGQAYACDCDMSTGVGICDMLDFLCFQNAFVGGCP